MRKALRVVAWIAGALLLALVAAFIWGRVRPPTPAQAEALKLLQTPTAPTGRNAWATLWLQDYLVPDDQRDAAYAQERARVRAWLAQLQPGSAAATTYASTLTQRFARLPALTPADNALLCGNPGDDCLAKVRAQAPAVHELLARQSGRLANLRQLVSDDVQWDDMPASAYTPLPEFGLTMKLLLTAPALDFIEGRQAQALEAICNQAVTVRRLHAHTNSLVGAMVDTAWMGHIERELAGMLAELPAEQAIPPACTQAFAPATTADVSLCAPMQREFDVATGNMAVVDPDRASGWLTRLRLRMLVDPRGMHRLIAPSFAWACRHDVFTAALADRSLATTPIPAVRYDLLDTVSNPMGEILARIAPPDYAKYLQRNQDYAAGLRLMAWLLQNRGSATAAADWQQRLATDLPALRQGGDRVITIDPDGRFLRLKYYARRSGQDEQVLPLSLPR